LRGSAEKNVRKPKKDPKKWHPNTVVDWIHVTCVTAILGQINSFHSRNISTETVNHSISEASPKIDRWLGRPTADSILCKESQLQEFSESNVLTKGRRLGEGPKSNSK
jgi:hypothetical protein